MPNQDIRNYFNVSRAIDEAAERNSKGLSRRELTYILVLGEYTERNFTESQLTELGDGLSTVSSVIKSLSDKELVEKQPTKTEHLRGAVIGLTKSGQEVYKSLDGFIRETAKRDIIGERRPIF